MKIKYIYILFLTLFLVGFLSAETRKEIEVGVDEKLGEYIPLDLEFVNSHGDTVSLKSLIHGQPTLLALVYYECPGICSPLLTELAWVVDRVDLTPEDDFQVVTVSFDHTEDYNVAANWKKNYLHGIKREFPESAWTFLTGDSVSIKNLTDAVGFRFKKQGDEFLHAGTLITIAPDGKISRYLFGDTYNQFDVKMALLDAESGKTSPTIAKMLQFCFSYDPEGRGYTLNLTRIIGSVMLIFIAGFFGILTLRKNKKN